MDGANGTAVGSPGNLDVSLDGIPSGVEMEMASLAVAEIELDGCEGEREIVVVDGVLDLLSPSPVEIPGGEWCSTVLVPDGDEALVLVGTGQDEEPFSAALSPDRIAVDGMYFVDGDDILFTVALGDGTTSGVADPAPPENDTGTDMEFAANVEDLQAVGSGIFVDANGNGRVDSDEEAVLMSNEGDGCSTTGGASGLATVLLGILGWRRRRGHPTVPG